MGGERERGSAHLNGVAVVRVGRARAALPSALELLARLAAVSER
jgi:hypothetical protein